MKLVILLIELMQGSYSYDYNTKIFEADGILLMIEPKLYELCDKFASSLRSL